MRPSGGRPVRGVRVGFRGGILGWLYDIVVCFGFLPTARHFRDGLGGKSQSQFGEAVNGEVIPLLLIKSLR